MFPSYSFLTRDLVARLGPLALGAIALVTACAPAEPPVSATVEEPVALVSAPSAGVPAGMGTSAMVTPADTRLGDLTTPIAKAQVAAALSMLGDKARADRVYLAALDAIAPQPKLDLGRADYGSVLRDSAALVTLASE